MKRNKLILTVTTGVIILIAASCGPLVTAGPDVVIGGGIYPTPVLNPPMGNPNAFRPGGPSGPGFNPGRPNGGGFPVFRPNNNPGFNQGGNPGFNQGGNNRVPGTGVGGLGNMPPNRGPGEPR